MLWESASFYELRFSSSFLNLADEKTGENLQMIDACAAVIVEVEQITTLVRNNNIISKKSYHPTVIVNKGLYWNWL